MPSPDNRRVMLLPYNPAHPDYTETHLENDWCEKAGCRPICGRELTGKREANDGATKNTESELKRSIRRGWEALANELGSAETGGEKAAPSSLSRVNFFGTRGYEGGVEAYLERTSDTTFALRTGRGYLLMSGIPASVADSLTWSTDPGPGSREPEKLNNAQADERLLPPSLSEFCKCPSLECPVHACEQLAYVGKDSHNAATVNIGELVLLEGLQDDVAEKYVHAINRRAFKLAHRLPPVALAESSLSQNECKTDASVSRTCKRGTRTCYVKHPAPSLSSPPPKEKL